MTDMAYKSKYAGLPDLDLAPDIYETPELTDDTTLPTSGTARSPSPFEEESDNPEIDRRRLRPDDARSRFLPAEVDARDVDFSDSIASRRKSYRSYTRKSKSERGDELGDASDDDAEAENLDAKLARLRRETEELKEELEKRKREREESKAEQQSEPNPALDEGIVDLSQALDKLHVTSKGTGVSTAEQALAQRIASGIVPSSQLATMQANQADPANSAGQTPSGLLNSAAAFEERLALLEAALGIPKTSLAFSANDSGESAFQPILPTLSHLSSQLDTLTSTLTGPAAAVPSTALVAPGAAVTTQHIEALTSRVRKLTADADALSSARRRATEAARAALAARAAAGPSARAASPTSDEHAADGGSGMSTNAEADSAAAEQAAKIQALYATLPTITSLHPLLPSVLERLRSLRAIHAGAARASEDLSTLEQRQAEMKKELDQWREGLEVVEKKVGESEGAMKGNMDVMGPWIKELERRMAALEGGKQEQ